MGKKDKKQSENEKYENMKNEISDRANELKNEIEKMKEIDPKAYEELSKLAKRIENAALQMHSRKYKIKMIFFMLLFYIVLIIVNSVSITGILGISHKFINFDNPYRYLYLIPLTSIITIVLTVLVQTLTTIKKGDKLKNFIIFKLLSIFIIASIDSLWIKITTDIFASIFIMSIITFFTSIIQRKLFRKMFLRW